MIYRLEFHVSQSRYSTNIFGRQAGRQADRQRQTIFVLYFLWQSNPVEPLILGLLVPMIVNIQL